MRTEVGLNVVHLFAVTDGDIDRSAVLAAIESARQAQCQVIVAAILGHKADVCLMTLCNDWAVQRRLQTELQRAGVRIVDSYVSVTEVSEYAKGMPEHMLNARLYPELPVEGLEAFCFYPMSKKREGHANWYATPYEQRNAMMHEHGASGRTFAGRVVQLISGSTGLDDHEWGVTLFATNPETVKEVVYTMRFDEGSALYGEFGAFYVGYIDTAENVFTADDLV